MIAYAAKLEPIVPSDSSDLEDLLEILKYERVAFNEVSKDAFELKKLSIVPLHRKSYYRIRKLHPEIPAQVVIRAEQACLGVYRSIKSNKRKLTSPAIKRKLAIRLDKRLYLAPTRDTIRITTPKGRKTFKIKVYPKLKDFMDKYQYKDPLLFVRGDKIYISLTFDNAVVPQEKTLALGVDLGIRVAAACSDGRIFIDRKFNGEKRKLRYNKRCLQSASAKGSKSAKRHLKKLRRKEHRKNQNQTHHLANAILKTDANVIALENLKGIKAKKHKFQNKNPISQVPLYELRRVLTYKAVNAGKSVVLVNPAYTSQTDSLSGEREGERRGRRFYTKSGPILDADLNAARNIGQRSKLPVSYGNILDGQAVVTRPIVGI